MPDGTTTGSRIERTSDLGCRRPDAPCRQSRLALHMKSNGRHIAASGDARPFRHCDDNIGSRGRSSRMGGVVDFIVD